MRYFKNLMNGYIYSISTGCGSVEISDKEYSHIKSILSTRPMTAAGYDYRLKTDLTWELFELPVAEEELSAEDALAIILGGEA